MIVKRRMAASRDHEAPVVLKGKRLNIPDETQFRDCTRYPVEVHRLSCEVGVVALVACCLALPLATLVLSTFRDLTAFLLILASNMELTLDVRLEMIISGEQISVNSNQLTSGVLPSGMSPFAAST